MEIGHFYFLSDNYFVDFPDRDLQRNKGSVAGGQFGRPYFFAFQDQNGLCWMVPISSQTQKYRNTYQRRVANWGRCDTLLFGDVLGYEKAFLIQNMCPVTEKYIQSEYINSQTNVPVRVEGHFELDLSQKAKRVLTKQRKGASLIFPDVASIEKELLRICRK